MSDTITFPRRNVIEHRMAGLEQRGVTIELECNKCGAPTDHTVLPEERDETHATVCRSCIENDLRPLDA